MVAAAVSGQTESRVQFVPPLENGDRLSRYEFERRFDATPNLKKAELIDGVVYFHPRVSYLYHARPHFEIQGLLGVYAAQTPSVDGGTNSTVRLDLENEPQPDVLLRLLPEFGGRTVIDKEGYVEGAPELIVEVAATSASYDKNQKCAVYQRHAVREYIIWRVLDQAIDWYILTNDRYEPLALEDGVYRSPLFRGLWLDASALIAGDLAKALAVLQRGIASR